MDSLTGLLQYCCRCPSNWSWRCFSRDFGPERCSGAESWEEKAEICPFVSSANPQKPAFCWFVIFTKASKTITTKQHQFEVLLWVWALCHSTVTQRAEAVFADLVLLSTVFTHTAHPGLVLLNWLTCCNAHGKFPFNPERGKKQKSLDRQWDHTDPQKCSKKRGRAKKKNTF